MAGEGFAAVARYVSEMETEHPATEQWAIYEGNVQAYRGLAISSQSLFLAVGAILIDDRLPFLAVLAFAMVTTWWVFFPVIFARTAIVDFHKFDLGTRFDRSGHPATTETTQFLMETDYGRITNRALRRVVYEAMTSERRAKLGPTAEPFRTVRQTRKKLDVILPALFTMVWISFAIFALV